MLAAATVFWLRDPLSYLMGTGEEAFGRYWANRGWLLWHIAGGTVALFAGPFQFWSGMRRKLPRIHRLSGYTYIGGILVGGASSFYLAFNTLPDFGAALFFLGVAWWVTTGMAFIAIRNRRIDSHKEWMMRSYVVTFAFVSFRYMVDLPLFEAFGQSRLATAGWISWVVPLMFLEVVFQWKNVRSKTK